MVKMVSPPFCLSSGFFFNAASKYVMFAGVVYLACVPSLPNLNSPDHVWPDAATTSRLDTYACGEGVMRLLRSVSRRDATRVHIIFTNLWQRRCPVYLTLLVVTIPLNHHPDLRSFTCPRAWPFGVRGYGHLSYMCTRRVFTWIARCPSWSSPKGKTEDPSNILPTLIHAKI